jgi:Fe-S-cluster containining protein
MEKNIATAMTDKDLQEAFKKLQGEGKNVRFIGLDDEVEFNCSRCGSCCTHRDDILLTPYDVYNLAVALNKTGQEIVNEYLDVYIGSHSHLPVTVIADTPQHKCPFLEFDTVEMLYKCKVNDRKPGPCRTHPFGIVRQMNATTLEADEIRFIVTDFCDNHGGAKITVREYLGEEYLNSLDDRKVSYKLQSFVTKLLNLEKIHAIIKGKESFEGFTDIEKEFVPKLSLTVRELIGRAYIIPYLEAVYNFKPDDDFLVRCEIGFKELIKSSLTFTAMLAAIGFDIRPKDKEAFDNIVKQYMSEEEMDELLKDLKEHIQKADEAVEEKLKELEEENADTSGN